MTTTQYAALLPDPETLHRNHGLDATTVLTLHRRLLARIQPPTVSGNEEEDGEIDSPKPMETDALAAGELFAVLTSVKSAACQGPLQMPLHGAYVSIRKRPALFQSSILKAVAWVWA